MLSDAEKLNFTQDIISKVNSQITGNSHGRLFAVVYISGRQHLVTTEDLLVVKRTFHPNAGDEIRLEKVLAVGGRDFTLFGRPLLSKDLVNVKATVVESTLAASKVLIKYKPLKRKINFERLPLTTLRINSIEIDHPSTAFPLFKECREERSSNVRGDKRVVMT
ncbi:UNVERIFIED_CONTAM: hypothetical protein GTU68_026012 [Idotea baltica]|nr:hypothetical protein [Idotea baltica]